MSGTRFELPTTDKNALADAIAEVRFASVRMRAGYNQDDVDRYLDELEHLVRQGASVDEVEASINAALFNTTRIAIGYDVDDVDDLLDDVIAASRAIEPTALDLLAAHYAAEPPEPKPATSYDFSAPAPPVLPLAEAIAERTAATGAAEGAAAEEPRPMTRRELRRLREEAAAKAAADAEAAGTR